MYLYSVKDRLAQEFAPPFMSHNEDTARRQCMQLFAKMPNTPMSDFELWRLCKFDISSGEISNATPTCIPWDLGGDQ